MLSIVAGVLIRIISNSYLNVFQKLLSEKGEHSSVINFYTYLGLTVLSFLFSPNLVFSFEVLKYIIVMGILGASGNYFIIKSLSCGELSTIAPINAYKPIVALVLGFFILNEIPQVKALLGIIFIILGTFVLMNFRFAYNKAFFYRFLALIFSGCEAIFIKKVILMTNISAALFYWSLSGLFFAFCMASVHKYKFKITNIKYELLLILSVGLMQYSTNFVFSKMNVAYALALFQLSAILSVFLGVNIFKEKNILIKLLSSVIMILGACIIIL